MLTAIYLDDNFSLMAGEVREVRTDRGLTTEMMLLEWRLAQILPKSLLGFGCVTTQGPRARHTRIHWTLRSL